MPPNSISLEFQKMPTVTVDGTQHSFKIDKTDKNGGYSSISAGGVTYSLVKDADSGRYTMTISGEPSALENYKFAVGKGRVTNAEFDSKALDKGTFFKGLATVGDEKEVPHDYLATFSISGGYLASRETFLQSGAWGLDQDEARKEFERLQAEKKPAASATTTPAAAKPPEPSAREMADELRKDIHEAHHSSLEALVAKNDVAALRDVQATLRDKGAEAAHRLLSDKTEALFPKSKDAKPADLAQMTKANLAKLKLKTVDTPKDGNCFFHAVGKQVGMSQAFVRNQTAHAMNDIIRRPDYLGIPKGLGDKKPESDDRDNTLLDASKAGTKAWGQDSHCAYVARAFDRPVVSIGPGGINVYEKDQDIRTIESAAEIPKNAIFLAHGGGEHWESATPIA